MCELNQRHSAHVNQDYLVDYPGFSSAYNISLNIPLWNNNEKWLDLPFSLTGKRLTESAIQLGRQITGKIEQLVNLYENHVIVVFIPNEWNELERYEFEGELFDLHDYIKAFAASKGISTQLIREETISDPLKCQICWWLSLSFYVKSLRTPWILNNSENTTAFAGIGYCLTKKGEKIDIVIGCSHIYNSKGQGLKYKLSKVNEFYLDKQANPFLSYEDSYKFGVSIRELFYHSMDKLPNRAVIHKRTKFTADEIKGITDSLMLAGVNNIDLIEINFEADARFMATKIFDGKIVIDSFPLSRGTCLLINGLNHYFQ